VRRKGTHLVSVVLTPEEVEKYEEQRKLDIAEEPTWKMEIAKMLATLALNLIVVTVLVWAALNTSAELSTRFMSLLEIVIGAVFGVTATQIAKG
jgi:F0F1-type ATP synthase membrane subunit a